MVLWVLAAELKINFTGVEKTLRAGKALACASHGLEKF
jgi:hypothetical protein